MVQLDRYFVFTGGLDRIFEMNLMTIDGVDEADVQLVWDPPWNQNMISEAGRMKLGMI